jgi:hypothetical protein
MLMNFSVRKSFKLFAMASTVAAGVFSASIPVHAQVPELGNAPELIAASSVPSVSATDATPAESSSASELPDAPSATVLRASVLAPDRTASGTRTVTPKYNPRVAYGETAQPLRAGDKVLMEVRDVVSLENLGGDILSATYSHVTNGAPNYGTNSTAFGQRVGAAVARNAAEEIFTGAVLAPIMRTDPRYYVLGPDHNVLHRSAYAITRVLITKTDGGRNIVNAPLLFGYVASSALNNAYYPQINRNFRDTAAEYGASLGGAALGFLFDEFQDDLLQAVHLKKKQ